MLPALCTEDEIDSGFLKHMFCTSDTPLMIQGNIHIGSTTPLEL